MKNLIKGEHPCLWPTNYILQIWAICQSLCKTTQTPTTEERDSFPLPPHLSYKYNLPRHFNYNYSYGSWKGHGSSKLTFGMCLQDRCHSQYWAKVISSCGSLPCIKWIGSFSSLSSGQVFTSHIQLTGFFNREVKNWLGPSHGYERSCFCTLVYTLV